MIWLELGGAIVAGALVGWAAHALYRRRGSDARRADRIELESRTGASEASTESPPAPGPPAAPARTAPRVSDEASLAGRVIVHLGSLGRLANGEIGRLGYTQKGMMTTLSLRQGTLTKVLSRLEAARVLEVDRRHVEGQPIRLKVYRLTALGESVAKELRHRRAPVVGEVTGPAPEPSRDPATGRGS